MKYFVDYLPITTGNDLRLYIDGKNYCQDLYNEISAAKSFIFLTGLHFMADFRLLRGTSNDNQYTLAWVLGEAANRGVQIYLLVNQFYKDELELDNGKRALRQKIMNDGELHGYLPQSFRLFKVLEPFKKIYCRTDIHPHSDIFGTNHQKTVVVDDKVAFLGGIDLTYLDGDRWDTLEHKFDQRAVDRTQIFWHDVHMRVQGPAVQFVRDNFIQRWKFGNMYWLSSSDSKGETGRAYGKDWNRPTLPSFPPKPQSNYQYPTGKETSDVSTVQIVRSMPNKSFQRTISIALKENIDWSQEKPNWNKNKEEWEHSAKDAYLIGIRAAQKYIYLENQWIADEDIWAELEAAAKRNNRNPEFRIILMVPYEGLFAAGLGSNQELWIGSEMEDVINASYNAGTFGMYSLLQKLPIPSWPPVYFRIYIHSKILIVDDEWALIGSANAGGISLEGIRSGRDQPDTELSAIILDRKFASNFRKSLWEEHLGLPVNTNYNAHDADKFRLLAGDPNPSHPKVRFFPGYEKIKGGLPTWSPITPPAGDWLDLTPYRQYSRLIPCFHQDLADALPPTLVKAAFKAYIIPPPPAGYRCWYRWKCGVFYNSATKSTRLDLKMLSLRYDKDEVWEYSDQATVYIGEKTARYIDSQIRPYNTASGIVSCRVQFVPWDEGPDPNNSRFSSLVLDYEVTFMHSEYATLHHPDFMHYEPPETYLYDEYSHTLKNPRKIRLRR